MSLTALFTDHLTTVSARVDEALAACDYDALVVFSGDAPWWFNDDQQHPFRCNPQFRLFVPQSVAGSWLLYQPGQAPRLLFHLPRDYWHFVAPLPRDFWTGGFDITAIAEPGDGIALLPASGRVAVLGQLDNNPLPNADLNPQTLVSRLNWDRASKTPYEVECLRRANRTAVLGHRAAAAGFAEGLSEFDINLRYMLATQQDSEELPYGNIIALNEHAATLHHKVLDKRRPEVGQRRSLLIDAGADCHGYGSDVTRSHAAGPGVYADLVSAVDACQQDLVAQIKPGLAYPDLHLRMHRNAAQILHDFSLIQCSVEDAVSSGITRHFLPHGLGHHLGLQVHDVGGHQAGPAGGDLAPPADHPYLRNTRDIDEKQVLTIEPGIYFIELLLKDLREGELSKEIHWDAVEALRPYGGARIEDNIYVTPDGHENLTRDAFDSVG